MSKFRTSSEPDRERGRLVVLSGPSGTGKGTIVRRLLRDRRAKLSVSCTTRPPREGEVDGRDYYFVTPEAFERLSREDGFLESAEVFGNRYGTPRAAVEEALDSGSDVILEIDVQGALQIKEKFPQACLIFILPPSDDELANRLRKRGTESEEQIALRLGKAHEEMARAGQYDYQVVNDDLERALSEIETIVDTYK